MNGLPKSESDDVGTTSARDASPAFRALLIGIDFYYPNRLPNTAEYRSLLGCVSDVDRVEKLLRARIPMPYTIRKLVAPNVGIGQPGGPRSAWPTYANIKAELDRLLAETQPGDHVYIHYSGHGGRILTSFPDLKGRDGYDETLVPTDIGDTSTRNLRDLDIAYYLDALTTKNQATVSVVLDSCHSGGATRGDDVAPRCATGAPEGVDPTLDTTERPTGGVAPHDELCAAWQRLAATGSGRRAAIGTTWLPEARDYVLLAACRDVESALEVDAKGGRQGVLTTAFLEALDGLSADQTWKALYERVLAGVQSRFPSQTPQLLGQGARQVLGRQLRPVVSTVRVNEIDMAKGRVKLGAGQVTGTREGARFGIYLPETTNFTERDRRVGTAIVETTMAVESWAKLEEGAIASVKPGAPAVLEDVGEIALRRAVNLFHRDDLPPGTDQEQALGAVRDEIERGGRGFLELRTGRTPDYYQVAIDKDRRYEIWDASGKPVPNVGTVSVDAPEAARAVVDRLIHLLRYQTIQEVAAPFSGLKDMLRIELLAPPPEWSHDKPPLGGTVIEPSGDAYVMKPDAWVFVRVVNDSNSHVNVAIIDLGDDYGIRALEPAPPEGHLTPTRRYSTVAARKESLFALQFFLSEGRASSTDIIKIFATVGDTDYWWLLHTPIDEPVTRSLTTRDAAAHDALYRLREALDADENTEREVRPRSAPGEDWTARQFRVVTKRT
ncbi:caspase family protein [Sorangium sp. So ce1153]|uniref:caspase family protein n=1 Tax=Sorangium sp. So ce1153 TaxID=3133333 RepID=UPI003F626323